MAILLDQMRSQSYQLKRLRSFKKPFLDDLIFYAERVHHFDPNFLPVAFHFAQYTLNEKDENLSGDRIRLVKALMNRVVEHADELSLETLSHAFKTSRVVSKNNSLDNI